MSVSNYNPNVDNSTVKKQLSEYYANLNTTKKTSALGEQIDESSNKAGTTTSRGTKVVDYGDDGLGKDSFLKLLVAQMSNMDPTQDQDSTAYVTQMAQFASIEQMNNLNTTMTGYSVRNLVGMNATVNAVDGDGNYIQGTVLGATLKNSKYYLSILNDADGKTYDGIESSKVSGVTKGDYDYTDSYNNSLTTLNTQFLAASSLKGKYIIDAVYDKDTKTITLTKGKVTGAYLDHDGVKVNIDTLDDDLNTTGTATINYNDIDKMGDITDEELKNAKPEDYNSVFNLDTSTSNSSNSSDSTDDADDDTKNDNTSEV